MGRFVRAGATRRLDLGDGDWVEIKDKLSMGDRAAISESVVSGGIRTVQVQDKKTGEEKDVQEMGQMTLGASNIATLERAVMAWGGAGFCTHAEDHETKGTTHYDDDESNGCRARAITWKSLLELDEGTGQAILTEVQKQNAQPSKEAVAHP